MLSKLALILLILYFLAVLLIGYISSKREKKEDYLIAGRKLGPWVLAFTITASLIGGNMIINYTGFVYTYGFAIMWGIFGLIASFFLTIPMARKLKEISNKYKFYTMSDYFSVRYGLKTGLIATIVIIIWFLLVVIVQFIAGARIISAISPVNYIIAVLLMGFIVLIYSLMGGFRAVVRTDIFQYLVFGILLLVIAFSVSQGRILEFSSFFAVEEAGIGTIIAFFIIGATFIFTAPEVWQRIYAGRDQKAVKKSLIISATLIFIALFSIGVLGLAARSSFVDVLPEEAAIMGLKQLLPPGLLAVGLVLFFAVIMSTIDTSLFILANNFSKDIWLNFIDKKANFLKLTRIGLIIFTFISVLVALFYKNILAIALSFLSIGLSFAPVVIGSFYFKLKPGAIKLALIMALISVLMLLFLGYIKPETSIISLPVSLVFLLIGQKIFKK